MTMPKRELVIDGTTINDDSDCYVVAEIGANHMGDVETCKELFDLAKRCGCNAVKLQKRDNRTLYTRELFDQVYDNRNSFGKTYGEHREFLEFGEAEYRQLISFTERIGVTFFATAFDVPSADFLHELGMPAFKIASGDLKTTPLLEHVARFGKPMIVSTGGGTMADIHRAYETIFPINQNLCFLQCTAAYPAEPEHLGLRVIETLRERFPQLVIGLSDHQNGIAMSTAAYVLGARVIEKHFTRNRAWKGSDQSFSLEPTGLRKMVRDLRRARQALGDGRKRSWDLEAAPLRKMAKALVASRDLPAGHRLSAKDIAMKSPADGLEPYHLNELVGCELKHAVACDHPFTDADLGR
jgi:N-acetylneuraminate synthase/sialic acid synthase